MLLPKAVEIQELFVACGGYGISKLRHDAFDDPFIEFTGQAGIHKLPIIGDIKYKA